MLNNDLYPTQFNRVLDFKEMDPAKVLRLKTEFLHIFSFLVVTGNSAGNIRLILFSYCSDICPRILIPLLTCPVVFKFIVQKQKKVLSSSVDK